ncbi:MAG: hypothetical protein U0Q16_12715 [Bryobacteraceae bacterium]
MIRYCVFLAVLALRLCFAGDPGFEVPRPEPPPLRIMKGYIADWKIQGLAGDLALRTESRELVRCSVLSTSHLMRAGLRIHPHGVRIGDWVEMIGKFDPSGACHLQTLYVRALEAPVRRPHEIPQAVPAYARGYLSGLFMRGTLTFTGIVNRMEDGRLFLYTRNMGPRSFAVRRDTVFTGSGRSVDPDQLEPYTRVFVRASRTYDGDLEAYYVIWGDILTPNR